MLHLITEVGKSGRQDFEKRHFPRQSNRRGEESCETCARRGHGRKYIPHGYGNDVPFRPHGANIQPMYTVNGPDWQSKLRWLPSPGHTARGLQTDDEPIQKTYHVAPRGEKSTERTDQKKDGGSSVRCVFNGKHKATATSTNEVTYASLFGKARRVVDKRNGIPSASPGDKSYQAPEFSAGFHNDGSTLPPSNFGGTQQIKPDTFVPLLELPLIRREPYSAVERCRQRREEEEAVRKLDDWCAATPLIPPVAPPPSGPILPRTSSMMHVKAADQPDDRPDVE